MVLHSQNKMNRTIYILIISILAFLCLHSCAVDIDPKIANTAFGLTAIKYEYIIMILSLCSGIFCIIGGIILTILGFTGNINWIIEGTDFTSKLINAENKIEIFQESNIPRKQNSMFSRFHFL